MWSGGGSGGRICTVLGTVLCTVLYWSVHCYGHCAGLSGPSEPSVYALVLTRGWDRAGPGTLGTPPPRVHHPPYPHPLPHSSRPTSGTWPWAHSWLHRRSHALSMSPGPLNTARLPADRHPLLATPCHPVMALTGPIRQ